MRNFTNYNDLYILDLIKQVNGNPHKCTVNTQYAAEGNHLIEVLVIYQDISTGWDIEDAVLFCERVETVNFCDDRMSIADLFAMVDYYKNESFQANVNDLEYEEEYHQYEEDLYDEWKWYTHARQMGWE